MITIESMRIFRERHSGAPWSTRSTVMFVDLRGYTGLAEFLPAVRVARLLEEFFELLTGTTEKNGGEVFHVAGDCMMAGFETRATSNTGTYAAFGAARAILQGFSPLAARWRLELSVETGIGIGLHTGEVARGHFGPPRRKAPTLVGDTVNIAARLCARARAGEVLFSSAVAESCNFKANGAGGREQSLGYLHLPQFALRGRTTPLDIWCVPAEGGRDLGGP